MKREIKDTEGYLLEMKIDLKRIIAETSAAAIPVTAHPEKKESWIRYSNSNEGEPDYYRDYLDPKTGEILYSIGETCFLHPWICNSADVLPPECSGLVLLSNENCDTRCFAVPLTQFEADFGPVADAIMQMLSQKIEGYTLRIFLEAENPDDNYLDALDVKLNVETGTVNLDDIFIHDGLDSSVAWRFCHSAGMDIEVQDCGATGYSSFTARTTIDGFKRFLSQHRVIPAQVTK